MEPTDMTRPATLDRCVGDKLALSAQMSFLTKPIAWSYLKSKFREFMYSANEEIVAVERMTSWLLYVE